MRNSFNIKYNGSGISRKFLKMSRQGQGEDEWEYYKSTDKGKNFVSLCR